MIKKVNFQQIVAGGLATTVLVSSCTKDALFINNRDIENVNITRLNQNRSENVEILPIHYTSDEFEYFNFLNQLASDIMSDPNIAKQFLDDPNTYLQQNGFGDIKIKMDDAMLKFVIALSNEEIVRAIENNDIQQFLSLMKKYDLISLVNNSDTERIIKLINENPELKNFNGMEKTSVVAFAAIVVVGAIVAVWAVAVTHAVTVNVAAAATVFAAFWAVAGAIDAQPKLDGDDYLIKLWRMKNDNNSTYVLINEYEKQKINELILGIKNSYPEVFNTVDEKTVRQLLSLNI